MLQSGRGGAGRRHQRRPCRGRAQHALRPSGAVAAAAGGEGAGDWGAAAGGAHAALGGGGARGGRHARRSQGRAGGVSQRPVKRLPRSPTSTPRRQLWDHCLYIDVLRSCLLGHDLSCQQSVKCAAKCPRCQVPAPRTPPHCRSRQAPVGLGSWQPASLCVPYAVQWALHFEAVPRSSFQPEHRCHCQLSATKASQLF